MYRGCRVKSIYAYVFDVCVWVCVYVCVCVCVCSWAWVSYNYKSRSRRSPGNQPIHVKTDVCHKGMRALQHDNVFFGPRS